MGIERPDDTTVIRVSVLVREAINILKKDGQTQDEALLGLLEKYEPGIVDKAKKRAKLWQQMKSTE